MLQGTKEEDLTGHAITGHFSAGFELARATVPQAYTTGAFAMTTNALADKFKPCPLCLFTGAPGGLQDDIAL